MHRLLQIPTRARWCGFLVFILSSCCGRPSDTPADPLALAPDEFSVMTYNLYRYSLEDRDDDGQKDEPKPREERDALVHVITKVNPDVLAVQEVGGSALFDDFRKTLSEAGLIYEFAEFLPVQGTRVNIGLLSRLPILSAQSHDDDAYSIGKERLRVSRGFIDVDIGVNPAYQFRLMVAHLKSKRFHPLGQTEMRRNEARLLNKHVRRALSEDPNMNLLVVGDMNDRHDSAALREVTGPHQEHLVDLRPKDHAGDLWTWFGARREEYRRFDYILASHGMLPEAVPPKSRVVRDPLTYVASDHRPVVAVFKAKDL